MNIEDTTIEALLTTPASAGPSSAPIPYNPLDAAKFDYVMAGAKRDAEGNLLTKEQGGGFKRDWKQSIGNALRGGALAMQQNPQGGLAAFAGGALAGGLGTAINPQAGREFVFDVSHAPRIQQQMQRQRQEEAQARQTVMDELRRREIEARAGMREAEEEERRRKLKLPRIGEATWGTFDTDTGQPIWRRPEAQRAAAQKPTWGQNMQTGAIEIFDANDPEQRKLYTQIPKAPRPPSLSESLRQAETNRLRKQGSVEKIARDSTDARKGEITASLPPKYRQILTQGYYETPDYGPDGKPNGQMLRGTPSDEERMAAPRSGW